jgi:hypothetical protein
LATISNITMGFNRTWLVAMGMYFAVLLIVVGRLVRERPPAVEACVEHASVLQQA